MIRLLLHYATLLATLLKNQQKLTTQTPYVLNKTFPTLNFTHVAYPVGSYPTLRIQEYASVDKESQNKSEDHTYITEYMNRKVRVLCWVMTYPANHQVRARHIKATWGKRCNKLLFMSTGKDDELPTVKLPVLEGTKLLWGKTKAAFKYIYEHHRYEADWFLKADDNTYVVVENLRYLLAMHNPNKAVYFGSAFKAFSEKGYSRGGAGYVLSRTALEHLVTKGLTQSYLCRTDDFGAEDQEMTKCLDRLGVRLINSRDNLYRGRFLPVPLRHFYVLIKYPTFYFWDGNYFATEEGLDWCSDELISFTTQDAREMYVADFLIYRLKPSALAHNSYLGDGKHMEKIIYEHTLTTASHNITSTTKKPLNGVRT